MPPPRQTEARRPIQSATRLRFLFLPVQLKIVNPTAPKTLLRLEGLVVLAAASIGYWSQGYPWGRFFLLFLAPDLLMIGYLWGARVGAAVYNAGHNYLAPFSLWLIAHVGHMPLLYPLALIWAAHIGFDRLLGYGLKYGTGFRDTHLGRV